MSELNENRLGLITASQISNLLGKPRGNAEWTKTAESYLMKLVAEIITGREIGFDGNTATEWGHDHEDEARKLFGKIMAEQTQQGGFVIHPTAKFGGTPDGYLDAFAVTPGPIEIKCPWNTTNFVKYALQIKEGICPPEHYDQVQAHIWLTESKVGYFVTYDPRLILGSKLHWVEVPRDEKRIEQMADAVKRGNEWISERVKEMEA